jgi:hypothetical protein
MRRRLHSHPSALLLFAQLASLLLYPIMVDSGSGRVVFGVVALVIVVLALAVVKLSPAANWLAWCLAIPAMICTAAGVVLGDNGWFVGTAVFESALYFYAAGGLMVYMLRDHEVTGDELFAAGATFTLLAWGFAYAYYVCQAWYPGSFTGLVNPSEPRTWMELLFLSFTTLSGVGLGDVLPLGPPARALVMLEEFAGVGYIATVVSRLIGLTLLHSRPPER